MLRFFIDRGQVIKTQYLIMYGIAWVFAEADKQEEQKEYDRFGI